MTNIRIPHPLPTLAQLRENVIELEVANKDATIDHPLEFPRVAGLYDQLADTRRDLRLRELRQVEERPA